MSKARVISLSVVHQRLTKAEAAKTFDESWQWVHPRHLARGGWARRIRTAQAPPAYVHNSDVIFAGTKGLPANPSDGEEAVDAVSDVNFLVLQH